MQTGGSARTRLGKLARRLALGAAVAALFSPAAGLAKDSTYKDTYDFTGANDQVTPYGEFIQAPNGKLYGALFINDSMIYDTDGEGSFNVDWWGDDGNVCGYGMTVGTDGALYGTCTEWQYNGNSSGIVFRFDPDGGGFTVLYSFPAFNNGVSEALSPLTLGPDGNFYGTTRGDDVNVYGTVFQVTPGGKLTTLHAFTNRHGDGATPSSGGTYVGNAIHLTLGSDGNLYGTTDGGGDHGSGTVYRITPSGTVTILYSMTRSMPCSCTGVTEVNGNLYGQTHVGGGPQNEGTIFQLTPDGTLTTLHKFDAARDSAEYPELPLTLGNDDNLYGASPSFTGGYGPESLYRITPAGKYTDLYNKFALPTDNDCNNGLVGCFENAPLYQATNGYYYGVTLWGGANSKGSMFRLKVRGAAPFVRPLLPVARPGQWLGILGQGFKRATGVSFGSRSAAFRVVSDTYLEAKMPGDAAKGKITVTMPAGELHSNIEVTPLH